MKNAERTSLTKLRLQEAFLALRRRKPIEQIRVTELCQIADTNRTTFYHYYEDIYSLSNAVEDRILSECLSEFPYRGMIYEDPEFFLSAFNQAIASKKTELGILGHGRELEQYTKIESWLVQLARKDEQNIDEEFLLTFIVGGLIHVMDLNRKKKKYSQEIVSRQILTLLQRIKQIINTDQ
jgi:AcrR family transcriptional regulator